MSAYIVDKAHVDVLVSVGRFGPKCRPGLWQHGLRWWDTTDVRSLPFDQLQDHRRELNELTTDATGSMLIAENVASVHYRYPDDGPESLPGPNDPYWARPYTWTDPRVRLSTVEALMAIRGYTYQACEHPGWETSEAKSFCDALEHALIQTLPGMDDAPWEWTAETITKKRGRAA